MTEAFYAEAVTRTKLGQMQEEIDRLRLRVKTLDGLLLDVLALADREAPRDWEMRIERTPECQAMYDRCRSALGEK